MCPIFVGSVHNFGKSDDDSTFSEKVLISDRCIGGLMSNLITKSWTDSTKEFVHKRRWQIAGEGVIKGKDVPMYFIYKWWLLLGRCCK